jgi:CTD small phosphatase-like protein 2
MTKINKALLNIIQLNYKNLIIIYEHILSKISIESKNNIWVKKLSNIINSYKKTESIKLNNISKISLINYNTNIIYQNIILILINFPTLRNDYFLKFIENLSEKSYSQINIFFLQYIFRTNNIRGSILASELLRLGNNKNFVPIPNPYVRTKNNKNYSLVLDLDETLVHFKEKLNEEGNGVLKIRPGIKEFLEKVGKYYELIIFTTATQDYADILIDAIEEDKIYFEHRFYRNHAIIINNDFVKDLTRIGRPLDKIIIVDNMPQNFRLQKENGINIKAFWGEDVDDNALEELGKILINIARDGGDVRIGLEKYRDEIVKKVTSNISRNNY